MKSIRKKKILSYIIEIALILAVAAVIMQWQSRNMLPDDSPAPPFSLSTIEGETLSLDSLTGKKTIIYFFAPWCSVCRLSSHNIASIKKRTNPGEVNVLAIGLSWDSAEEVRNFARDHDLPQPVLLGTEQTGSEYRVQAFPSIYILDENGTIRSRMVGYSTEAGIRLRLLLL